MKKLLSLIISAGVGLWLATLFIPGVLVQLYPDSNIFGLTLTARWQLFLLFGVVLGLLNYFVKPILTTVTLPLRVVTLGLFGFLIYMALIWAVDLMFKELTVPFLYPLAGTAIIIWALNFLLSKSVLREDD